jgi:hypothetical protein
MLLGACSTRFFEKLTGRAWRRTGYGPNNDIPGGIADIYGFHQGTPFYFNGLDENQACNNRQKYLIII